VSAPPTASAAPTVSAVPTVSAPPAPTASNGDAGAGTAVTVIGAGAFGTALAVLLARSGVRATLQTRTAAQMRRLRSQRENSVYLPGVELPAALRVESVRAGVARADHVFLALPACNMEEAIVALSHAPLPSHTALISVAKGLASARGLPPTMALSTVFGSARVACVGGPAHARELLHAGAALVVASTDERLAGSLARMFVRTGVLCEPSNDPVGVELAGAAKNLAALAAGATEAEGLNAAGAAAGHIFSEVWHYARTLGARPESMIGVAGVGDLLATALARESRNRRAGELLAEGVPAAEIPARIGHAVEALESTSLLARTLERAGVQAPVTRALADLIAGELVLAEWVALVRAPSQRGSISVFTTASYTPAP
jgi:glycerol-3-phosphate dehydrogenase (NAD(P)+)